MIKYIIFDFDGTLVDSGKLFLTIFDELSENHGLRKLDSDEISSLRKISILERCKLLNIPLYKLPSLANEFYRSYKLSIKELLFFDGIKELLEELKQSGYEIAIISSNSKSNIESFLDRSGLKHPFQIVSSSNIFGKDKMLKKFLKLNNLNPDEVIYIGDEHRDIVACKKCGINIIWVGWGFDSIEAVAIEKPDFTVHKPNDILEVLMNINKVKF